SMSLSVRQKKATDSTLVTPEYISDATGTPQKLVTITVSQIGVKLHEEAGSSLADGATGVLRRLNPGGMTTKTMQVLIIPFLPSPAGTEINQVHHCFFERDLDKLWCAERFCII